MSKKQLGAPDEDRASSDQRSGWIGRLRAQPGFRTATIVYILVVALGLGGTVAYASWSRSAPGTISGQAGTAGPVLPANTALIGAQPALQARPGTPSEQVCSPLLTDEQMRPNNYADINFSWSGAAGATQYVVTVKGKNGGFSYDQSRTVSTPAAEFRFGRLPSDQYGKPVGDSSPFYTSYTVRVLPMAGTVPGDPLYFTYKYEHYNASNCFWSESTGASPIGSAAPVVCADPTTVHGNGGYSDLKISWAGSAGATSYSVTMTNADRSYGGETSVTGTNAAFRIMRPQPEKDNVPYFATYTVRVQPMKGAVAGDPVYLQGYQFYAWGQKCG